jgi:hypothetical protein
MINTHPLPDSQAAQYHGIFAEEAGLCVGRVLSWIHHHQPEAERVILEKAAQEEHPKAI